MPPILCAAVEVGPDEQQLDLEEVELGLRALWEAVATQLERHPHCHLHVKVVPELCEELQTSEEHPSCSGKRHRHCHGRGCGGEPGMGVSG